MHTIEQIVHVAPGTVYDQDYEASYIPPRTYDIVLPGEETIADTQPNQVLPPWLAGFVAATLVGSVIVVATRSPSETKSEEQSTTSERPPTTAVSASTQPSTCPHIETKDEALPKLVEASRIVANMEFVVTQEQFDVLAQRLDDARSFEDIELVLNDVFMAYDMPVHIASVPQTESQPTGTQTSPPGIEQDIANLSVHNVKVSATHLLEGLSSVPTKLLEKIRGTELYLTTGILVNGGDAASGSYLDKTARGTHALVIGVGQNEPTKAIFWHELTHAEHWAICGAAIAGSDSEFASLNPPDFRYTRVDTLQRDAAARGDVISPYAASNATEDVGETGRSLFVDGLCPIEEIKTPACEKLKLLAEREATVEPNLLAFYVFRREASHPDFPKENAEMIVKDFG